MLLLAACSNEPSKVRGAPLKPPDESYETGGARAWRVLVWHCNDMNERFSMTQSCAEGLTGCGRWQVDRTLCPPDQAARDATRTPSEREIEGMSGGDRHPIPDGYGWR